MMGNAPSKIGEEDYHQTMRRHCWRLRSCRLAPSGDTVFAAKQTCYRRLKQINLPNSPMWRTDIGDRLAKQLPKLQDHGFAAGMSFSD